MLRPGPKVAQWCWHPRRAPGGTIAWFARAHESAGMAEIGVLTVDDQEFFLTAAREVIEATPGFFSAGEASSGSEALQLLELQPGAQLALVDVRMPGMNGVECAERMREARPDLAVVLISSGDVPGAERKEEFGPARLREIWNRHRG
jgi:CheY-like chemotaxis protein